MRKKSKKTPLIKKIMRRLVGEAVIGALFALVYVNREAIMSVLKGEETPETAEE